MELGQYFHIVWKRRRLIVLCTLLVAGVACGSILLLPPIYSASTSLLVSTAGPGGGDYTALLSNEHLAKTYTELLSKRPVFEAAGNNLGMDPDYIAEHITVELIPDTTIIKVTAGDRDPYRAMQIANGIVEAFQSSSREMGETRGRSFVVIEPAVVPTEPARDTMIYALVGSFAGFVFSVGLAFLIELLQDSFETSDDVRQKLAVSTLCTIPRLRRQERGGKLVTVTHPGSPVSEAYRVLWTNLRFANAERPQEALLVTSAEPGAGKTTIAANLGIVSAQAGFRVVVVDANLRHPALHELFNVPNTTGLADLLTGSVQNVNECMVKTEIENLGLIPSGAILPTFAGLVGSKRMKVILDKVRQNADLVILDTPATLVAADAAILASMVTGVILAIEAERTSRSVARQACEALQNVGATILGVALTKTAVRSRVYVPAAPQEQPQPDRRRENKVDPLTGQRSAMAGIAGRVISNAKKSKVLRTTAVPRRDSSLKTRGVK